MPREVAYAAGPDKVATPYEMTYSLSLDGCPQSQAAWLLHAIRDQ